jgi:hypothetical protein
MLCPCASAGTTVSTDIKVWTGIGSRSRITALLVNPFTQEAVADGSKELDVLKVRYSIGRLAGEAGITRTEIKSILKEEFDEAVAKGLESFSDRFKAEIFANWRNEDPTRTTLVLEEQYQNRLDAISSVLSPFLERGVIEAAAERLLRDEREFDIHIFEDWGIAKESLEEVFSEIPKAAEAKRSSPMLPIAQYLKEHADIHFVGVSTIINSEALRPIRENIRSIFEDWDDPNFGAFDPTLINTLEWEDVPLLSAEFKHELDFSLNGGTGTGEFRLGVSDISISKVRDVENFMRSVKASMGLNLENYVSPSQRRIRLETGIEFMPFQDEVLTDTEFTISTGVTVD